MLEPDEVGEMGDCMGALARAAGRAEEDLSAFLAPGPRCYLLGSLAAAASRLSMWLLPELHVRTLESLMPSFVAAPLDPCANLKIPADDHVCSISTQPSRMH